MRELHDLPAVNQRVMHRRIGPLKLAAADLNLKALDRFDQRVPRISAKTLGVRACKYSSR